MKNLFSCWEVRWIIIFVNTDVIGSVKTETKTKVKMRIFVVENCAFLMPFLWEIKGSLYIAVLFRGGQNEAGQNTLKEL